MPQAKKRGLCLLRSAETPRGDFSGRYSVCRRQKNAVFACWTLLKLPCGAFADIVTP
jgi:hypothetical protein